MIAWHLAVPGLVTAGLAFRAGGFFPDITGLAAVAICVLLVLRVTVSERPFEGWSAGLAVSAGALALLAGWTLVSATWSDAAGRALLEFDRALLYVLLLVLMGLYVRRTGSVAVVLRWVALAIGAVCLAALLSRLAPDLLSATPTISNERLSWPLGYWNAMGALAAVGAVLSLHLTASEREPAAVRLAAAGALPVIATTLYFTFSRGGVAAAGLGALLYVALARPRGLIAALPTVGFPLVAAVMAAYDADLLATADYADAAAAGQRSDLLVVVAVTSLAAVALRALGLRLDERMARTDLDAGRRRAAYAAVGVACVAALTVGFATLGLGDWIDSERRAFERGDVINTGDDLRQRFTVVGNNGRLDLWSVARESAADNPWQGTGAGTYQLTWERDRPAPPATVRDAHSLYLEVLAELGWPGLLLLVAALLIPLTVAARRLAGPARHPHAAFIAAGVALLAHAAVDWDWEMPVLFAWLFGTAGVVLAAPPERAAAVIPGRVLRVVAGLACLVLAATPVLVIRSQAELDRAVAAFLRSDCATAVDAALGSLDSLRVRAEPFEVLGWCDLRSGATDLGLAAMQEARRRDPGFWQYSYAVAVSKALAGDDPRPDAARARRLNPHEPLARRLELSFLRSPPRRWARVAGRAGVPAQGVAPEVSSSGTRGDASAPRR